VKKNQLEIVIHLSNSENNEVVFLLKKPEGLENLKSLINQAKVPNENRLIIPNQIINSIHFLDLLTYCT